MTGFSVMCNIRVVQAWDFRKEINKKHKIK